MKLFLIAALATSVTAFAPSLTGRASIALRSAGTAEIEAALAASKEFGATSNEARVLWDIVEEMDASDNRYVRLDNSPANALFLLDAYHDVPHTTLQSMTTDCDLGTTAPHSRPQ